MGDPVGIGGFQLELDVSRRQNLQPFVREGAPGHILDKLTKTLPLVGIGRGIGVQGEAIDAEAEFTFSQRDLLFRSRF